MNDAPSPQRLYTGISSLDDVLLGGLPKGRVYLVEGDPGTGKTTLATQFILEGKKQGERCLYVTLSESKAELEWGAESHGWSLDGIAIAEFMPDEASIAAEDQYTVFHPGEVELATTTKKLLDEIERVNPERLVIDSLSEFRLLAQDAIRYRRQILILKRFLAKHNMTALLLDDRTSSSGSDMQVASIVHGVFHLQNLPRSYGVNRRRLEIVKIRGLEYRQGYHDYSVDHQGVVIYPRLVSGEYQGDLHEQPQNFPSGLAELDTLFGGGVSRGSSTLILGPTGIGKSSLGMQYAFAAAARGERAVIYSFDEDMHMTRARTRGLGMQIDTDIIQQHLQMEQVDPAELSPGEFVHRIRREVEKNNAKVIVIDSLNGFRHSMPGEDDLALQLHELLIFLDRRNVTTFLVLTQHGNISNAYADIEVSYLADNVLLMRYYEESGHVRRAISALKKRGGPHEQTVRALQMGPDGIHVGKHLVGFSGLQMAQELRSEDPEHGSEKQ